MLPKTIETERLRLRLRPWSLGDVDDVLAYAVDAEWARFLPVPQPYKWTEAEEFVASQVLLDAEKHQAWAIEHQGSVIGGINLRFDLENRLADLGYSIVREFWGKGLATEAAGAIITEAFTALPELNKIRAWADARNLASLRVMEKVGMSREGLLRQNRVVRDEAIDDVWCGILRNEWGAARGD
jgi:RimJ/RimL family protein N-acetyltransferase